MTAQGKQRSTQQSRGTLSRWHALSRCALAAPGGRRAVVVRLGAPSALLMRAGQNITQMPCITLWQG
jgi:hypothetical protein